MSRDIDTSDLSALSQEDLLYLQARGRLTPEQEQEFLGDVETSAPQAPSLDDTPYTGDENTAPSVQTDDGSPTLSPDDYADASNERLKEELRRRRLSTSGNKQELIERLEDNDAGE
jgi:hypothetical protein